MGNSFVLFYVSMEISWGNFHLGEIGHTQKVASSWAGSNSLVSPHLLTILGGNILNYIKTVFWHDANAPTLSCITYIFMEGKKTIVHRLIHHTTTESGLVVSISYRPHFKQIASSLHSPFLTQRILLVRRRPLARIYGSYSMSFNSSNVGEFFTSSRKQWRKRYTALNSVMLVQGYLFLFLFSHLCCRRVT